ncbi:hypothetical protein J5N97_000994 [Dioscorea zingiberensis]|uniref:Uncharacterized protein n=1 Tax=Dioscorea zingiberensis TaxID=325984 RepID=A0A9D5H2N3_9LILI|nr:hypothetical protein J5N97_000994 [Dioscorea zingiberensis]
MTVCLNFYRLALTESRVMKQVTNIALGNTLIIGHVLTHVLHPNCSTNSNEGMELVYMYLESSLNCFDSQSWHEEATGFII